MDNFKILNNDKGVFRLKHKDEVGILEVLHTPEGPKEVIRPVHEVVNSEGETEYIIYNYDCMSLESLPSSYTTLLKQSPDSEAIKSTVIESIKSLDSDLEKYLILTRMLYFCRNEIKWHARLSTDYLPPGNDEQRAAVVSKRSERSHYIESLHILSLDLAELRHDIETMALEGTNFHPITTYRGVRIDPAKMRETTEKADSQQQPPETLADADHALERFFPEWDGVKQFLIEKNAIEAAGNIFRITEEVHEYEVLGFLYLTASEKTRETRGNDRTFLYRTLKKYLKKADGTDLKKPGNSFKKLDKPNPRVWQKQYTDQKE